MLRTAAFTLALLLAFPFSARAVPMLTFTGGNLGYEPTVYTIWGIADEPIQGVELFLRITGDGPVLPQITNIDLIQGTIFESNNIGQSNFAPDYMPPSSEVAAFTGTVSGYVEPGIVGFVTIDRAGAPPGVYYLEFDHPILGPSGLYTQSGTPSISVNGPLLEPEPSSVVLGLLAAGFGALVVRKSRRRRLA